MVGEDSVDCEIRHRLVHNDYRHAVAQALLDYVRRRRAVHHDDRANAILEDALDDCAHVAPGVRGVEQHALKAVGNQRCRERSEALGMERLVEVGANQTDNIGSRVGEALRKAVDAVTQLSSDLEHACSDRARYTGAWGKSARDG